ncbi:hypothetical protein [Corynebacterium freneyi]|uniref:hypothetical protein n=1 Tax=Corynebacterium freneyi TaxID=134034 RepID=UPI001CCBCC79|nr:hypothetical protein [Corynebacterium freneyi]UBI01588.1 hypothetical protein LA334_08630 [Corynebacterium freneyi]
MSDLPAWVSVDFDVEHDLAEAMYPHRYRAAYRAVWDARDRIALVGRMLAVSAGVMAAHALVQTAITASELLNATPLLWGAGAVGWTWAAREFWCTARRIEEVTP